MVCRIVINEARKRSSCRAPARGLTLRNRRGARHQRAPRDGRRRAALASLLERQRLALFLRYYADLDYAGIAEALGISRGRLVSATLHAAHLNP